MLGWAVTASILVLDQVGRAVEIQVQARQLGHPPTQAAALFDQHDRVAGVGQVERGLEAGNPAADDQPALDQGQKVGRERLVVVGLGDDGPDRLDGLVGGRFLLLLVDPARLLADVGDLGLVGVDARRLGRLAEGGLVHRRRAGGDDDAVQPVVDDVVADELLAGLGAHVLIVYGIDHFRELCISLRRPAARRRYRRCCCRSGRQRFRFVS